MKFNESKEDVKELTIDSKIKSILDELSGHENSRVKSISKSIISHFQFGSVTEFPEGSIEMFVVAFAALNNGTSVIKVK